MFIQPTDPTTVNTKTMPEYSILFPNYLRYIYITSNSHMNKHEGSVWNNKTETLQEQLRFYYRTFLKRPIAQSIILLVAEG